jgi:hypothetical protein
LHCISVEIHSERDVAALWKISNEEYGWISARQNFLPKYVEIKRQRFSRRLKEESSRKFRAMWILKTEIVGKIYANRIVKKPSTLWAIEILNLDNNKKQYWTSARQNLLPKPSSISLALPALPVAAGSPSIFTFHPLLPHLTSAICPFKTNRPLTSDTQIVRERLVGV